MERNRISWIEPSRRSARTSALRIGILNIMPRASSTSSTCCIPSLSVLQIEPIWIRLQSHSYRSWDQGHLDELYVTWEEALVQGPLDGLIITGAPRSICPSSR